MIQMKALNTPTPPIANLAWRSATLAASVALGNARGAMA